MGRVIDEGDTIRVRTGYVPRPQAIAFHARSERYACLVAHRRFGKTVAAINDLIRACYTTPLDNVRVAYIAPYLSQSKAIAWDYLLEYTAAIPDIKVNIAELRIDFPNGARIRLFGADNYNAMRGLYFDAVVLDEPADFPASAWPTVIRPALADRKGKATFIGTPKGKNEFWEIYNDAKDDPNWYCAMFKASETSILDEGELVEARRAMGDDRYEQEFECSFEAAIQGAYYAVEMKDATNDGRISRVPYDPALGVVTAWDLGIGDSTSIWFAQFVGQEIRIIDYHENSGVGLDAYAKVLKEKPYHYEQHILPHDVQVKELGTGKSRLETLEALGIRDIEIAPKLSVDDGIQAARSMLARCWFDGGNCERGIEALRQYRRDFDEKLKTWRGRPLHDWTSHGADAFRYLAVGYRPVDNWGSGPIRRNLRGIA
jgi:phage terminase large subunit